MKDKGEEAGAGVENYIASLTAEKKKEQGRTE